MDSHRVRDVMTTEVLSCTPSDSAEHCARLMWEKPCGAIAVVDGGREPISIITDRDICMAAWTQGRRLADITVASAMSDRLFTVRDGDRIAVAEGIMRRHGVRRLLVVDRHSELTGIISFDDIARRAKVGQTSFDDDPYSAECIASTSAALAHGARGVP